jgi:adenine-specific DNA methylase
VIKEKNVYRDSERETNMKTEEESVFLENVKDIHLLVTPHQNLRLPVYNWITYKHSFSRDFVWSVAEEIKLDDNKNVLDPFCGAGITMLSLKEKGVGCIGTDILPISSVFSNSRLKPCCLESLERNLQIIMRTFLEKKGEAMNDYGILFEALDGYFDRESLSEILLMRNIIESELESEVKDFFMAALLSVLEEVSLVRKGGAFLRKVREVSKPEFRNVFLEKLKQMIEEVEIVRQWPATCSYSVTADARALPFSNCSFDSIITSPPYPNRHDYTRIYFLELAVLLGEDCSRIKDYRSRSIRSHVEAKEQYEARFIKPRLLNQTLEKLSSAQLPNRQILKMLGGYFNDMHIAITEAYRVLVNSGYAVIVISDVAYGGVIVPVGEILNCIAAMEGFRILRPIHARVKGNSPQQMKKYGRQPVMENILVWQK